MTTAYVKDMSVDDLREIIEETVRRTLESYVEDLQALSSASYLDSIQEAREDYRHGRTVPLEDLLNG
ncbi:MAG TPA: hypothetical protein VHC97_10245 [Thermoanaerobaculia bacterium]|jgi:hypothetical protein|nr:hypothetical protein [Thermoanaerobaculia bacterium]